MGNAMKTFEPIKQILFDSLRDIWSDLWTSLVVNLLWTLCLCLIVPGPAATLALFYYGSRLAHGEAADFGDFWTAFRRYWGPAWRWGALNLLVLGLLGGDVLLTGQVSAPEWAPFVQGFYLAALAGWLLLQWLALAFLFEQERLSLRQALRNAAVMIGKNPVFMTVLGGLLVGLLALGTLLFMLSFAFGGVILATTGCRTVQHRLQT
jgi:hypothetical protein